MKSISKISMIAVMVLSSDSAVFSWSPFSKNQSAQTSAAETVPIPFKYSDMNIWHYHNLLGDMIADANLQGRTDVTEILVPIKAILTHRKSASQAAMAGRQYAGISLFTPDEIDGMSQNAVSGMINEKGKILRMQYVITQKNGRFGDFFNRLVSNISTFSQMINNVDPANTERTFVVPEGIPDDGVQDYASLTPSSMQTQAPVPVQQQGYVSSFMPPSPTSNSMVTASLVIKQFAQRHGLLSPDDPQLNGAIVKELSSAQGRDLEGTWVALEKYPFFYKSDKWQKARLIAQLCVFDSKLIYQTCLSQPAICVWLNNSEGFDSVFLLKLRTTLQQQASKSN